VTIRSGSSLINRWVRFNQGLLVKRNQHHEHPPMTALHCNRCGRRSQDLTAELPTQVGPGTTESALPDPFFVCVECSSKSNGQGYRYCGRCGNETPSVNLFAGRCDWCRTADDVPYEEPDDDDRWEEEMDRASTELK
jgi:hypothetical protein